MLNGHKKQIKYWQDKLGLSDYGTLWLVFIKGLVIGLLIHHFLIL